MSKLLKSMFCKRKGKCPGCNGKLAQFGVNIDEGTIECLNCHTKFNPVRVLKDSDIVFLSESLPSDKQGIFLTDLGFEKQPAHRTSKSLLYVFLSFIMLSTIFFSVILALGGHHITFLSPIIGGLLLCYGIYHDYRSESAYQWKRDA